MKAGTRRKSVVRTGPETKPVAGAVIVYDSFDAGHRAFQACDTIRSELGHAAELNRSAWKFELLRAEKLRQIAAADAAEADFVVVSCSSASQLPQEIRKWFSEWVGIKKRERPGLLLALIEENEEHPEAEERLCEYFRAESAKAGMKFLSKSVAGSERGFVASRRLHPK